MPYFIPTTTNLQVGTIATPDGGLNSNGDIEWQTCSFDNAFASDNVIVIPMLQSREGGDTPNLRIRNANSTGFSYRVEEVRCSKLKITDANEVRNDYTHLASTAWHQSETLGYVAFCLD